MNDEWVGNRGHWDVDARYAHLTVLTGCRKTQPLGLTTQMLRMLLYHEAPQSWVFA